MLHPFTGYFEDKHQRLLFFPNLDTAKWNPKSDENGKDPNVGGKKNEKQEKNSGDINYDDIYADLVEKVRKQFDCEFYEKFARR